MSLRLLWSTETEEDQVWTVAWSPVKPWIAYATGRTVHVCKYALHDNELTLVPLGSINTEHTRTIRALSFRPDGNALATASFDSTVGIWEPSVDTNELGEAEWVPVEPLEGHENEVKSVAWNSAGNLLATCSRDKSVWVWEAFGEQGELVFDCAAVLMEHTQDVKCVKWHPHVNLLASASYDDTIKIYAADEYDEWSLANTLTGHASTVWCVAWSPCGRYLASCSEDKTVKIWSVAPAAPATPAPVAEVQDGGRMGPWSASGVRVPVEERYTFKLVSSTAAHDRPIFSLDWSSRGLATASADGNVHVYAVHDGQPSLYASVRAHAGMDVNCVAWKGDLLATSGDDACVNVYICE